jgi:hypothetical protein
MWHCGALRLQARKQRAQLRARGHEVDLSARELELRALKSRRQVRVRRLLDHARPGESNRRGRLAAGYGFVESQADWEPTQRVESRSASIRAAPIGPPRSSHTPSMP